MASRKPSVKHPSHSHPLRVHKAQVKEEIICSGCNLDLVGAGFKCTKSGCDYFLHKSCFELRPVIHHKAHPDHPLTLLYSTAYKSTIYGCNACGEYGSEFVYNCAICQYDLHIGCLAMPETMKREEHRHPLTLLYHSPYKNGQIFDCDECEETIPNNLWSYYCKKCDYGTHFLDCTVEEDDEEEEEEDDEEEEEEEEEEEIEPKRGGRGRANNGENKGASGSELATMLETQTEMEKMQIGIHFEMQNAKIAEKAREAYRNLI